MTDIVERLLADNSYDVREVAADEIERLRRDVRQLHGICDRNDVHIKRLSEYNVQLEGAIVQLEGVIFRLENK